MVTLNRRIRKVKDRLQCCYTNAEHPEELEKLLDKIDAEIDNYIWKQN
jgi:hypothetical protein